MVPRMRFFVECFFVLVLGGLFFIVVQKYYTYKNFVNFFGKQETVARSILPKNPTQAELDKLASEYKKEFEEFVGTSNIVDNAAEKADAIPVLVYHGISSDTSNETIPLNEFKEQMFALKKAGYKTVTINEFYEFIKGEVELTQNSFLLTFDDARKDSYYPVDSILSALDFHAVVFVITGHSLSDENSSYYLSKAELHQMADNGRWDIQSHGRADHGYVTINEKGDNGRFIIAKQWLKDEGRIETDIEYYDRIRGDLLGAKKDLEKEFNNVVISFAFPFGDYGDESQAHKILGVVSDIYPIAFYQFRPEARTGYYSYNFPNVGAHSFTPRRIKVFKSTTGKNIVDTLEAGKTKTLPFFESFINKKNWISTSTEGRSGFEISETPSLILNNNENFSSRSVFLVGSSRWNDFKMNATAKLKSPQSFSLLARVIDGNNYVSCTYQDNQVALNQITNKKRKKISEASTNNKSLFIDGGRVSISVYGNFAKCYLDKTPVVSGKIFANFGYGGVGFNIWNSEKISKSSVEIKDIEVKNINED